MPIQSISAPIAQPGAGSSPKAGNRPPMRPAQTVPPAAPQQPQINPSVNTNGQPIGGTLNTTA